MTDLPRFVDVTPSEFRELLDSLDNPDRCLVCRRAFADDEMSALVLIQDEQLGRRPVLRGARQRIFPAAGAAARRGRAGLRAAGWEGLTSGARPYQQDAPVVYAHYSPTRREVAHCEQLQTVGSFYHRRKLQPADKNRRYTKNAQVFTVEILASKRRRRFTNFVCGSICPS